MNILKKMVGGNIANISRACNLICIQIQTTQQDNIFLHIQSFLRILKGKKVILSSDDMYRCGTNGDIETFKWDIPGTSIFDDSLNNHYSSLSNAKIIKVCKHDTNDIDIIFEHDYLLQVLVDTCESEEKYRIFNDIECIVIDS